MGRGRLEPETSGVIDRFGPRRAAKPKPDRRPVAPKTANAHSSAFSVSARNHRFGDAGAKRARPRRHPAGTGACRLQLAIIPSPAQKDDPCL
jgi:hypothetical protein